MSTTTTPTAAAPSTNSIGLNKNDYKGGPSTLCIGCGHDSITNHIITSFYELGINPHMVAKMSGIGCSSKTPAYFMSRAHGFNSVHGRMPSVSTGAKVANRNLNLIAVSGDGDTASIGLGQFSHLIRRNLDMVYIVENNGVYGLTKGQFSATADKNSKLKYGAVNPFEQIDICELAITLGCGFVARSFSGDPKQLVPLIKAAVSHKGTAIIDCISPCVTFNNHEGSTRSYLAVKEKDEPLHEIGYVHGAPEIRVDYPEGSVQEVELADGSIITLKKLDRDFNPTDKLAALNLIETSKREGLLLTGLFYVNTTNADLTQTLTLTDTPLAQLKDSDLRPGTDKLSKILKSFE
ncbi:MAG: 2-oxoacid:ferredoxin oxidoreductase subunit beta [Oligoflexia bacterium]|nr:2-oxoacid:ferredoxin oxidoreductase subunit beta [Oligoflexia bacterium]